MNFKKIFCVVLALLFVPCISMAASGTNLITNNGFEDGFKSPWQNYSPNNTSLNTDPEYVKTGSYSLQLSTNTDNYPCFRRKIDGLVPGAEYTYSAYVKTEAAGTNLQIKFEWYDNKGDTIPATHSPSYNLDSGDSWGEITGTEVAPEGVSYVLLYFRMYGRGTAYWDDISFYMSKEPLKMMSLVTDDVFYYSDREENGEVTVTLNTDFHEDLIGQTVQLTFSCGEETLQTESLRIEGEKLRFSFPMTWIEKEKTKYTFRCTLGDEALSQNVYRYPRPNFIRKDGVYEEKGEEFHPVYMYGVPDDNKLQENLQTLKNAGINLVQGYASTKWTDACRPLGMKQIIVLYIGSQSAAANDLRLQTTRKKVQDYMGDSSVFAWAVKDEPDIKPSTLKELEAAYVAIRNIDDNHPVWITCNSNVDTLRKYADVISYDGYPYNNERFSHQTAKSVADSVEKAKGKPVYSLLQAFEENNSRPTASQLGSMIYQSYWGGAKGIGFFKYHENDPKMFLYKTEKYLYNTELWPTVLKFSSESRDAFSVFVKNKETPVARGESDDFYWYVKKIGTTFWLAAINKSSTEQKTLELAIDKIPLNYEITLPDGSAETDIRIEENKLQIHLPEAGYTFVKLKAKTGFFNSEGEEVLSGQIGETVFPLRDPNAAFSVLAAFRTNGDTEELTGLYIGENEVPFIEGFHLEENTVYKLFSWDDNMKPIDKTKYVVAK